MPPLGHMCVQFLSPLELLKVKKDIVMDVQEKTRRDIYCCCSSSHNSIGIVLVLKYVDDLSIIDVVRHVVERHRHRHRYRR